MPLVPADVIPVPPPLVATVDVVLINVPDVGNVSAVVAVAVNVTEYAPTVTSVLPSAMVTVAPVAGDVHVILLTDVAVATPRVGVVKVGDVALTADPVPVVVTASSAVPPEFTATILLPFPESVGSLSKPASIRSSSERKLDDDPDEPVAG